MGIRLRARVLRPGMRAYRRWRCVTWLPAVWLIALGAACSAPEAPAPRRGRVAALMEAVEIRPSEIAPYEAIPVDTAWLEAVHAVLVQRPDEERAAVMRRLLGDAPALISRDSADNVEVVLRELEARLGSRELATLAFFRGPGRWTRPRRPLSWDEVADSYGADRPHALWLSTEALRRATLRSLRWPVASTAITSPFGLRYHPILGGVHLHRGIDIAVPEGTPVHAAGPGVVRRVREDSVSGRWVLVDHGFGVSTLYCHNAEVVVRAGQRVEAGEVLSLSGTTGLSTGPHLHFQVQEAQTPIDLLALHRPPDDDWTPMSGRL